MRRVFRDTDLFNLEDQIYPRPNHAAYDTAYWCLLIVALVAVGVILAWRG